MEYIQVAGKTDIYLGYPGNTSTLVKLGEQMDETRVQVQTYFHDVSGDRHGGPQGPPIERQALGQIARCDFALSRWDHDVLAEVIKHGVFGTEGTIANSEVGALLLRDRSYRLVLKNARDNSPGAGQPDPFYRNFVCATLSAPINWGQGTKHSILQFSMESHRAPEGHPKAGILYDRDVTGLP